MEHTPIKWDVSREEMDAIARIADRAEERGYITRAARMGLIMDLTATNANGCPLDLTGLAEADDFNFAHDVTGIMRHIDRKTGQLTDCFLPRFHRGDASLKQARGEE